MDVRYLKKDGKKARFKVTGINSTIANAIRRAVMTYVPSMAVDRVTIYDNTSPLYDEMLAQRIGLMPLSTDLKTYSLKSECKCKGKGCGRCEVSLILEKTGPGTVYSEDIKSRDAKVKPVFNNMPLAKLGANQRIKMEMIARLGTMSEHAKYQPGISSYKQLNDRDFEFFVESYNDLDAVDLLEIASDRLEAKVEELEAAFLEAEKKKA